MDASCGYGSASFGFALIASFNTSIACGKSSCSISNAATREASCDWPGSTFNTLRYASSARSVSPFSSSDIPSTKCVSASALCAPSKRSARSAAGLELDESSWPPAFLVADEARVFGHELFGFWLAVAPVATRKSSVKKRYQHGEIPQLCFWYLTPLMLVSGETSANQPRKLSGLWPGRQFLFELGIGRSPETPSPRATLYT